MADTRPGLEEGSVTIYCPSQLNMCEGVAVDSEGAVWAGGKNGELYRLSGDLFVVPFTELKGRLLGITPAIGGGVLVCVTHDHCVVHVSGDGTVSQVGPSDLALPNFTAYGRDGRLYITDSGSMGNSDGRLIRLDPDGTSCVLLDGLPFPNGLAFTADFSQLYLAQSETRDVVALDVDEDGGITGSSTAITTEQLGSQVPGDPMPDGLAVDQAGNVYVTLPRADAVVAVTPSGEVVLLLHDTGPAKDTEEIAHGQLLRSPTNIAFGGADLRDVYIANLRTRHLAIGRSLVAGLALPGQIR